MKKLLAVLLTIINAFTFFIGLGFLFGDDEDQRNVLKQE